MKDKINDLLIMGISMCCKKLTDHYLLFKTMVGH